MGSIDRKENQGDKPEKSPRYTIPPIRTQVLVEMPLVIAGAFIGAEIGNLSTQVAAGVPWEELAILSPVSERVNLAQNYYASIWGALLGAGISTKICQRFTRRHLSSSPSS